LLVRHSAGGALYRTDLGISFSQEELRTSLPAPWYPVYNFSTTPQSCAEEYWEPRRSIRSNDFQMEKDRLFNSLDCLGPPFQVNMADITHNNIPAIPADLSIIYGGKLGFTPKIRPEKLATHGFDHFMTPNIEFHPFLPAKPGWPGLMLRSDDELEEWRPEEGKEFRVVIRREPRFLEYVGQYEMMRLGEITGDEWKQQPTKVPTPMHADSISSV